MFTSLDKAIIAAIMGILSIIDILWGIDLFGWGAHTEQTIAVILMVLSPIFVWLIPNRT